MDDPTKLDILGLLSNPDKAKAALAAERAAKTRPGWLGIRQMSRADWQTGLQLGEHVVQVDVDGRSAPYRAGLRSGDFLKPIVVNGAPLPLDDWDDTLPIGTVVGLQFWRRPKPHGSGGWLLATATLTAPPRTTVVPKWKLSPEVPCGARVQKRDRKRFLAEMSCTGMRGGLYQTLARLTVHYDSEEGAFPSLDTLATDLKYDRRSIIRFIGQLRWKGLLKLVSGPTPRRPTNTYHITWPTSRPAQNSPTLWA